MGKFGVPEAWPRSSASTRTRAARRSLSCRLPISPACSPPTHVSSTSTSPQGGDSSVDGGKTSDRPSFAFAVSSCSGSADTLSLDPWSKRLRKHTGGALRGLNGNLKSSPGGCQLPAPIQLMAGSTSSRYCSAGASAPQPGCETLRQHLQPIKADTIQKRPINCFGRSFIATHPRQSTEV